VRWWSDSTLQQSQLNLLSLLLLLLLLLQGLSYLHSKHVVHFDLKSANLLFTIRDRTPTVKVADFGLSKRRHQTYETGTCTSCLAQHGLIDPVNNAFLHSSDNSSCQQLQLCHPSVSCIVSIFCPLNMFSDRLWQEKFRACKAPPLLLCQC
jgi:serine/threonine protein kinase